MTNKTVEVLTIAYYDEEWLCIERASGCSSADMKDIYNHCSGIGNKIYYLDGNLYFDKDAFFNIDLMFTQYDFITI